MESSIQTKAKGKRRRKIIRYLACTAKVTALSRRNANGEWKVFVSWGGFHNHARGPELFKYYSENRRITDPDVLKQVGTMKEAGASAKGILKFLREKTGSVWLTSLFCLYMHSSHCEIVYFRQNHGSS